MRKILSLAVLVASIVLPVDMAQAARRDSTVDRLNIALSKADGVPLTNGQTREAILAGVSGTSAWSVVSKAPGKIRLQYSTNSGSRTAIVDLVYRPGSYDVMYVDSDAMGFRERRDGRREIRERYRQVVDEMVNAIAFSARSPAIAAVRADDEEDKAAAPAGPATGRAVRLEDLPLSSEK